MVDENEKQIIFLDQFLKVLNYEIDNSNIEELNIVHAKLTTMNKEMKQAKRKKNISARMKDKRIKEKYIK